MGALRLWLPNVAQEVFNFSDVQSSGLLSDPYPALRKTAGRYGDLLIGSKSPTQVTDLE